MKNVLTPIVVLDKEKIAQLEYEVEYWQKEAIEAKETNEYYEEKLANIDQKLKSKIVTCNYQRGIVSQFQIRNKKLEQKIESQGTIIEEQRTIIEEQQQKIDYLNNQLKKIKLILDLHLQEENHWLNERLIGDGDKNE